VDLLFPVLFDNDSSFVPEQCGQFSVQSRCCLFFGVGLNGRSMGNLDRLYR
jgi:chromosome segregation ATPase